MRKRTRWLILAGVVVGVAALLTIAVIRYVPWHKLIRVPTSSEMAFIRQDPMNNKAPNTLRFDFEVDSTQGVPNGIYQGIAHSGTYSAKAFGKNSFSVSVVRTAGEIGLENLKGVALSAWVYAFPTDEEVNGSLVFAANNSVGANICWKGVHFSGPMVPREQWTKISGYYDLSDVRLRTDDQIQLYFWNNSNTELLVDDFYFVFGAPRERIGDSARVDMTVGYTPGFNTPPYPLLMFENQEIGNGTGPFLTREDDHGDGEISPSDKVVAGYFITKPGDRQSVLVIRPGGKPELFHYCPARNRFAQIGLDCPSDLYPVLGGHILLAGSFLAGGTDQLLAGGPGGLVLLAIEPTAPPCGPKAAGARFRVIWKTDTLMLATVPLTSERKLTCGDLNGDHTDELLLFDRDGSWKLLKFVAQGPASGQWSERADGKEYKVRAWNPALAEFRAVAGPWLNTGSDQVLTIFRDAGTGKCNYMLHRYLPGEEKFSEVYPDRQGGVGLTIGIDTLKVTDQFIPGRYGQGTPLTFLRYNRDWRFDLKEIAFNDTTFRVLHTVDFTGYDQDRNPKYYEILKVWGGNWIDPGTTSLLVAGRNCLDPRYAGGSCETYEDHPAMPGMVQIYSHTPNKP